MTTNPESEGFMLINMSKKRKTLPQPKILRLTSKKRVILCPFL